jgi:hypothetical protein
MLRVKQPAKPREVMKEHERWAGHITFLTITAALAAALMAAFAAIFADPGKIHGPKFLIVGAAFLAMLTLFFAIVASVHLSNYLVWCERLTASERTERARKITFASGAAFYCLGLSSFALFVFFCFTAFSPATESNQQTDAAAFDSINKAISEAAQSTKQSAFSADSAVKGIEKLLEGLKQLDARIVALEQYKQHSISTPESLPTDRLLTAREWQLVQAALERSPINLYHIRRP